MLGFVLSTWHVLPCLFLTVAPSVIIATSLTLQMKVMRKPDVK